MKVTAYSKNSLLKILVVEDDVLFAMGLKKSLEQRGEVIHCLGPEEAFRQMATKRFDVAFIDMDYDGILRGPEVVERARDNGIYPIALSGNDGMEVVEEAYQKGVADYLPKLNFNQHLERIFEQYLQHCAGPLNFSLGSQYFITGNSKMLQELSVIPLLKGNQKSVYIAGPTGVGKSLVAKQIHMYERLPEEKFVAINCSSLSPALLESELFGHEKGAFTGAANLHRGKLEQADGGTLFLDEIGSMPLELQVKLLKALEEKTFYRVGGHKLIRSQFRIISASWEDLLGMVKEGQFRPDLYFRLSGITINLPPLKERSEDLWPLIKYFMGQEGRMLAFSPAAKAAIEGHDWPGNIRELKKFVETLTVTKKGLVEVSDLPPLMRGQSGSGESAGSEALCLGAGSIRFIEKYGLPHFIGEVEKMMVGRMASQHGGKVRAILKALKISSTTYYRVAELLHAPR